MRYVTITLNAAIDTTYRLDSFTRGRVNRVSRKVMSPGGKGNNVAKVLAALGHSVIASGFIAGTSGAFIEQGLQAMPGITTAFLPVVGESRTCLTLVEQDSGMISEILEPGVEVSDVDADRFLTEVGKIAAGADVVILSGSLPRGLPADYYAQILTALRSLPAQTVLDSSGVPLRLGLSGQPHLIKPNAVEMVALMGREGTVGELVRFAQRELLGHVLNRDAQILLSLGEQGAALIRVDCALIAQPPPIEVVNPVGAGDAMLAGFLDAASRHCDDCTALIQAVATGTAAALQETAGVVDKADIKKLSRNVQVRTI
jgi:tagatose 6-phosphate kinase